MQMKRKASIFVRVWGRLLLYGTLLISGAVIATGAIMFFFTWPWLTGAYLHGGVSNLLVEQRVIPSPWPIVGWAWLLVAITGTVALYQTLTLGDNDGEEWADVELEQLGCCPSCGTEIERLVEQERNTAYDEAVRKCPECDAILGVVGTNV
jgi:hypothetical protein